MSGRRVSDQSLLEAIDKKLDALKQDFNDYRVAIEGRLTKVETKASIFGAVSGVVTGIVAGIFGPKI